jgi:transketolase
METQSFDNLETFKIKSTLATTPNSTPKYFKEIINKKEEKVKLADPDVSRALIALMNQHAVIGGAAAHWGGPSAFTEIMSAVHGILFKESDQEWYEQYNFINDAGHAENGVYAIRANYNFDNLSFEDLKGFRSITSKLTGHGEAHLNPEGVLISNGPLGSGLPQAQGLAISDKALNNNRITICTMSDGAAMEGEAKESFAAIPGLASKGLLNPVVTIISDNNTKLSGRITEDSFSMNPSFISLETLGWNVIYLENGHDLQSVFTTIEQGLEQAKSNSNRPVAIIIKTIKGKGIKSTEESASGGHGYPLKAYDSNLPSFIQEIFNGNAPEEFISWAQEVINSKPEESEKEAKLVKEEKVQKGIARAIIRSSEEGLPIFSLSSDLPGSTGIKEFQDQYPNRCLDLGIAESNMVSTAIGFSKNGFIPIVDTFAQFGVTKGNLPLTMASLSQAPIIALFSHTGFQDAADGASHQATTYFASTCSIPDVDVINCSCSSEADFLMYQTLNKYAEQRNSGLIPKSTVFFLGRENYPEHFGDTDYQWGKAQILKEGTDITIVATGATVKNAMLASELMEKSGVSATVINSANINNPDTETIGKCIKNTNNKLIMVEDHQVIGGMGSILSQKLLLAGYGPKALILGINNQFGQSAYKADHLYDKHGYGPEGIKSAAATLLRE